MKASLAAIALTAISFSFASAQGSPAHAQQGGAPPCVGRNPHVAVPTAPHGMYVWLYSLDEGHMMDLFSKYVIGKDPALCGASAVVSWSDIEKTQGSFDFTKVEQSLKPFLDAGLTVNLLFAAAGEGKQNPVTPHWVMQEVPKTFCGGVHLPIYWNPKFEAMWSAYMKRAITYFSNESPIRDQVGYLRFATGAGAEAVLPPGANGGPCAKLLANHGYSYQAWKAHTLRMLDAMASVPTKHQVVAALPRAPGGPTPFDLTNVFAAAAAAKHVGFSFESLGAQNVTAPGTKPGRCQPAQLHWCAAYTKYAGVVPLAMQPITASMVANPARIDISNLLQYALDNKIQIFELYPGEWLQANGATVWQQYQPAQQAKYKAALQAASRTLGVATLK
ncbi:MAG TPA: hypothetical protein VFB68_07680 [Xanthobacteraceae bacterium]|nr:hypothetical protein [Xanthobacteraceae bacterium]